MRDLNMGNENIACKEVMAHICDNLGEDLESPNCMLIKKHIEECENCNHYFKSVETTIEFYKKYNVKISEEAHNRLMECLGLSDHKND